MNACRFHGLSFACSVIVLVAASTRAADARYHSDSDADFCTTLICTTPTIARSRPNRPSPIRRSRRAAAATTTTRFRTVGTSMRFRPIRSLVARANRGFGPIREPARSCRFPIAIGHRCTTRHSIRETWHYALGDDSDISAAECRAATWAWHLRPEPTATDGCGRRFKPMRTSDDDCRAGTVSRWPFSRFAGDRLHGLSRGFGSLRLQRAPRTNRRRKLCLGSDGRVATGNASTAMSPGSKRMPIRTMKRPRRNCPRSPMMPSRFAARRNGVHGLGSRAAK